MVNHFNYKRALPLLTIALVLLVSLFLLIYQQKEKTTLKKIDLYLQWEPQAQFLGYYIAEEKGFFRENGFDVQILHDLAAGNSFERVSSDPSSYANNHFINILSWQESHGGITPLSIINKGCNIGWLHKDTSQPLQSLLVQLSPYSWWGANDILARTLIFKKTGRISNLSENFTTEFPKILNPGQPVLAMKYNELTEYIGKNPNFIFETYCDLKLPIFEDMLVGNDKSNLESQHRKFVSSVWKGWDWALKYPQRAIEIMITQYKPRRGEKEQSTQLQILLPSITNKDDSIDNYLSVRSTIELAIKSSALKESKEIHKTLKKVFFESQHLREIGRKRN